MLLSVIRIFIYAFWGEEKDTTSAITKREFNQMFYPTIIVVLISVAFGIGAEWVTPYMVDAARVLADPSVYIDAIMKGGH